MIRNKLFNKLISIHQTISYKVRYQATKIDIASLEKDSDTPDIPNEEQQLKEERIEISRNKSRLRHADRDILFDKNPYPEPRMFHHGSLKYLRRTYGRYGVASGINPSICWPTKEEFDNAVEYERVAYPFKIKDMIVEEKQKKKEKMEKIQARQIEIGKKLLKLEGWKRDLQNRIDKKESEAKGAKERKERLVEEVRRHFGYSVDPRDDKFKELLEKKEKEQRKAMKEEKRKMKEAKLVEKLKTDELLEKEKSNTEKLQVKEE